MQNPHAKGLSRFISAALVLAMVLAALPPFELPVFAAGETHTFDSGAVYIDSSFNGDVVIIKQGVFSVTVNGAQNVELVFGERTATGTTGVTMNRRSVEDDLDKANGSEIENLYYVSEQLGYPGKAQTCPLMITGNSTVEATFLGQCRFYAGTNACVVNEDDIYTAQTRYNGSKGNGFAGIQVDSGSTFTIVGAEDLKVFGSHQFAIPGEDGMVTITTEGSWNRPGETYTVKYSEVLRANDSVGDHTNPGIGPYVGPDDAEHHDYSGGAGIGGGATLQTANSDATTFTNGTPGNIIINDGNIEIYGGHQAAGIGGAVNSPATSGMIQINGGNIVIHGGRFAAGIGDGDSTDNLSTQFDAVTSLIEINGGNIEVYGGVASSGIGTTDELSEGNRDDWERKLQINLNGGVIRAYSGFPKEFNGNNYPNDAPAAIGAGSITLTPANSIYVSSEADLRCAGFGNYSLTENGIDANAVPTISVDSDGYLLLLRTSENGSNNSDQFHSTENRTFTLYSPIKVEFLEDIWTVYIDQQHNKRYLVNEEGTVYEENASGTDSAFGSNWKIVESGALPSTLTLYINAQTVDGAESKFYDEDFPASTILETVEMAYYFRSIALTLPHPDEYGGIYALGIPINGIDANDIKDENGNVIQNPQFDQIALTVEATQQGTQSGWIDFPSGHNMQKDNTAAPIIDLDVDGNATIDGLIGDNFDPNIYAYTVYAEPGTTQVDIYFAFEQQKNINGTNIVHKIDFNGKTLRNDDSGPTSFTQKVTLTGTETVVRIKKTDANNTLGAVSYKVTIILKDDLTLTITDPGKEYDSQPAEATVTGALSYPLKYDIEDHPDTTGTTTITPEAKTIPFEGSAYINRTRNYMGGSYTYYIAELNYQLHILPSGDTIYYVFTFNACTPTDNSAALSNTGAKIAAGWTVTKSGNSYGNPTPITNPDSVTNTVAKDYVWISNTAHRVAAGNNTNLVLRVNGTNVTLHTTTDTYQANNPTRGLTDNNRVGRVNMLSIGTPTSTTTYETTTSTQAQASAEAAISRGDTSGSFEYEVSTTTGSIQPFTSNTYLWNGSTNTTPTGETINYKLSGTYECTSKGTWVIVGKPDKTQSSTSVTLPAEDLEKVIYTYYVSETNTVVDTEDGLPVDAGEYYVIASLTTQTYNAKSERVYFTITRRPVEVLRIEKWLTYVTSIPDVTELHFPKTTDDANGVPDIGYVELGNIVGEDEVEFVLPAGVGQAYYYDGGETLKVDYRSDKIVLAHGTLQGGQAKNYYLQYANDEDRTNEIIRVYGQLAYYTNSSDGSMFRLDEIGGSWDKYFPVDGDIRVGANGNPADYHSPTDGVTYYTHAEYIRARTVNAGEDEARYCIDIEYGAMSFGFFRSVWNVEELDYEDDGGSFWTGMDGSNNKLTVINRSNRKISYTLTLKRASGVNGAKIGFEIKTENVQNDGTVLVGLTDDNASEATGSAKTVNPATAGENPGIKGTAATDSCYLIMSKVPQFPEGVVTNIGTISILFKPVKNPPEQIE